MSSGFNVPQFMRLFSLAFLRCNAGSGSTSNNDGFLKEVSSGSADVFSGNYNFSSFEYHVS